MKLLITKCSPVTYYFLPLTSKYSPKNNVLNNLNQGSKTNFHPHKKKQVFYSSCYSSVCFNPYSFRQKMGRQMVVK